MRAKKFPVQITLIFVNSPRWRAESCLVWQWHEYGPFLHAKFHWNFASDHTL